MNTKFLKGLLVLAIPTIISCGGGKNTDNSSSLQDSISQNSGVAKDLRLPAPDTNASKNQFTKLIGWSSGKSPVAPAGFSVTRFAEGLQSPRWVYEGPNGDIFVAESATESSLVKKAGQVLSGKAKANQQKPSANRITLLRDADNDGIPELKKVFLTGLKQPLGMLVLGDYFYVANTDGLVRYPYKRGDTQINSASGKLLVKLPAGGYNNHWTRNIIANQDGSKIFISVGSGSNVGENGMEHEVRRANILEVNPDGSAERVYAAGLRNPVGMDWAPGTTTLWTAVNERDGLGDDLVPDYITGVKEGGFYGWPYAYFGKNEDPRMMGQAPELTARTLVPDIPLGAHTASLGLAFYKHSAFPQKYRNGAFIGQHGSWNRSVPVGYKVVFVPFKAGKPVGKAEDFLTGFMAPGDKYEVYGRPVGVTVLSNGRLLVADDGGNIVWAVSAN